MDESLVSSLRLAVAASPDDLPLRLLLARLLVEGGLPDEAISVAAAALKLDSENAEARAIMSAALTPVFDWSAAEEQVDDVVQPMFIGQREVREEETGEGESSAYAVEMPARSGAVERFSISLDDVGGMKSVKARLNAAFLAPLKNPELRRIYSKSLRGGLLMYGPPGCGKTYIAKAVAGELGASFISVSLADVLDPMFGTSEQNVHRIFETARANTPCVLFFDEIDALGQRRSMTRNTAMRGVANQLLIELDGVADDNEGVFVLGATNQPWDVDDALRRPGRFDRTVFVAPPDSDARVAIFRNHLAHRPVEGIDLLRLAQLSEELSGADIAYVCEAAAERALLDSVESGVVRFIGMQDLLAAVDEVKPSSRSWFASARNVVMFGADEIGYSELKEYFKKPKRK